MICMNFSKIKAFFQYNTIHNRFERMSERERESRDRRNMDGHLEKNILQFTLFKNSKFIIFHE